MPGPIVNDLTTCPLLTLTVERDGADELFRRCVRYDGARAGAGDLALGICRERTTTDGDIVPVDVAGTALAVAGGAFAAGADLAADAEGRVVAATRSELHVARTSGAAANTDINVAGIAPGDEVVDAINLGAAVGASLATLPVVHSAGKVRTPVDTSGGIILLILWRTPPRPIVARALAASTGADETVPVLLGVDARAY